MARVKHHVDMRAFETLSAVLSSIRSPQDMRHFLKELLTPGEVRDITLRWKLLELLDEGVSQRKIAEELKISLCKITRGSRLLKQKDAVTSRRLALLRQNKDVDNDEAR